MNLVICKKCREAGQKSTVHVGPGAGFTTLAYHPPFYDEDGRYHHHDANVTTQNFRCSNDHTWTESTTGSCWCGWPDEEKPEPEEQAVESVAFFDADGTKSYRNVELPLGEVEGYVLRYTDPDETPFYDARKR